MKFELAILSIAVYNLFYGAFCWEVAGIPGLIIGSIFMVSGCIIGVILRNKFALHESKDNKNVKGEST